MFFLQCSISSVDIRTCVYLHNLLSLQIDPSVLSELPHDIRKQVEQEMQARKSKTGISNPTHQGVEEPGCSHWSSPVVDLTNEREEPVESSQSGYRLRKPSGKRLTEDDLLPLPSPSQVNSYDFSVSESFACYEAFLVAHLLYSFT